MKKWLKSLFRSNSLNEIEEEFEAQPTEAKVYQSHSIDKNKSDESNRPKFRFPLQLDEEITTHTIEKEEPKVEPVLHQQKNYDFWQAPPQTIDRLNKEEIEPTYNQSIHSIKKNQMETYEKNEFSNNYDKKEVPKEKEEKVDIVFRPKRKTPFKPSEYISPIYGYQRPAIETENELKIEPEKEVISESNAFESIQSKEIKPYEVESPMEKETIDFSKSNLDRIEINQAKIPNEKFAEEIHVTQSESIEPLIENEVKELEIKRNVDSLGIVTKVDDTENEEVKNETVIETEDRVQNESNSNEREIDIYDEVVQRDELVTDEMIQAEEVSLQDETLVEEEVLSAEMNQLNTEEEVITSLKENSYDDKLEPVSSSDEDLKTEQESTNVVAETIENEKSLDDEIKDQPINEVESNTDNEVSETTTEVKREKKRHIPFNVMMLRSDVEAARKATIMRQLRELQNESAATIEKVDEEVKTIENERDIETVHSTEESNTSSQDSMNQLLEVKEEMNGSEDEIENTQLNSTQDEENVTNDLEETSDTPLNPIHENIKNDVNYEEKPENLEIAQDEMMPPVLYELPELDLLNEPPMAQFSDGDWVEEQKQILQETLHNFNVGAKVIAATQGPTVTRFEVQPEPGVKVNKITNLQDDIKLSLAARDIRIEAPIPGRSAIGIEVPNQESKPVYLRELVRDEKFLQSESPLTVALGLDIGGDPVYADIAKMPHGLIAGATGSGKSVCINSILVSILYKAKPHEVKLILIDPKMVELAPYNHIPHLISPVITDARAATAALKWACDEMDRRYDLFAHAGARDIKRFNDLARKKGAFNDELPYLVIIIDELADLMMVSPGDVETYICRIAQKARACGIHLLVATQRPSVDVITGIIKSNIPTRIAFTVSSQVDSRTIIDIGGAEKLLGRGDMLFLDNGKSQAVRLQGVFVSDDEIEHVVEIVKDQQKPNYLFNQEQLVAKADAQDVDDELFKEAVEFIIDQKGASVSMLQRRFRIGYNRAARLVDLMFDHGIVSNQNGSKPRDVLITLEEFRSEE